MLISKEKFRHQSLITGRGETKWEGSKSSFTPTTQVGANKVLAMLKGERKTMSGHLSFQSY